MYKSPLVCSLTELDYAIDRLSNPKKDEVVEPFCTGLNHYEIARSVLCRIKEVTGIEYRTVGDFILSVMPNEETRSILEVLLQGAGRQDEL